MTTEGWALVFAIIAFLTSVISPTISVYLTNRHQRQMYDTQFYHQHYIQAIDNYAREACAIIHSETYEQEIAYGAAYGVMLVYAKPNLKSKMISLDALIQNGAGDTSMRISLLNEICALLAEQIDDAAQHSTKHGDSSIKA